MYHYRAGSILGLSFTPVAAEKLEELEKLEEAEQTVLLVLIVGTALVSFLAGLLLVPVARRMAGLAGLNARATADRWHSSDTPVPKTGGLAMLVAFLGAVTLGGLEEWARLWPLVMLSTAMFAIGLADDIKPARPSTKLVCQLLATSAFVYVSGPGAITGLAPLDIFITFGWIVGITNAFNLLDNIDGLAAGIAIIAALFFAVLLVRRGPPDLMPLAVAAAALAGAAGAFLFFNQHPASVFMGDSGSHLLGSFIAGATLMSLQDAKAPFGPTAIVPIVILFIPILDTAFVTLTRSLSGRSAFVGGRDHLSHRLVALGLGDRRAVLVLYILAAAGGFVALGVEMLSAPAAWGLAAAYLVTLVLTGFYLAHIKIAPVADGEPLAPPPLPSEITNRYRVYEVLIDALVLGLAYYFALLARFRGSDLDTFLPHFYTSLPLVVGLQLLPLWLSGKYRQVWRMLGPAELFALARGLMTGVAASIIALLYLTRFEGYSRRVFAYDAVIAPVLVISVRVALGALDHHLRLRRSGGRTAVIVGAGRGGVLALHELLQNSDLDLMPIGFVDDDPRKRKLRVEGLPILGTIDDLAQLIERRRLAMVVVSIRDLPRATFDRICSVCRDHGVEVRRMRFALEDVEWRDTPPAVVRFPGAS